MATSQTQTTHAERQSQSTAAQHLATDLSKRLDTDPDTLSLLEGAKTGYLYAQPMSNNTDTLFSLRVTGDGLTTTAVEAPDEELDQLAHISPNDGADDIEDKIDSVTFAGD